MNEKILEQVVAEVIRHYMSQKLKKEAPIQGFELPVGASGRHVHLSQEDVDALFGPGHQLVKKRDLSQPGQFVCEERITIIGPKHIFQNVAVLGPVREHTQIEISYSDARQLGVDAPVALSGHLEQAADISLASGNACVRVSKGLIIAKNHIHMSVEDAVRAGVQDGDLVDVVMETERPMTFRNVPVRAGAGHSLEMHIDFDEMNACMYQKGDRALLVKSGGCCTTEKQTADCCREELRHENECEKKDYSSENETFTATTITTRFLTEQQLQKVFREGIRVIRVGEHTIISPLANDFARQNKMTIQVQ